MLLSATVIFLVILKNFAFTQLYEGDLCQLTDAGEVGVCMAIDQCSYAKQLLISKIGRPRQCGFNKNILIVCCTRTVSLASRSGSSSSSTIAGKKCQEYNNLYGVPTTAPPVERYKPEIPHMAILGYEDRNGIKWKCSGSLISEKFILTAASCINTEYGRVKYVNLGENKVRARSSPQFLQEFKVLNTFFYSDYNNSSRYHDIALIELDGIAKLGGKVIPACLQTTKYLPDDELIASTWITLDYRGGKTEVLQRDEIFVVAYETCKNAYNPPVFLERGVIDDWQICGYGRNYRADACKGRPGGAAQIKLSNQNLFTVIGVASFRVSCNISPRIYTRVSHYIPWIEGIVWSKE